LRSPRNARENGGGGMMAACANGSRSAEARRIAWAYRNLRAYSAFNCSNAQRLRHGIAAPRLVNGHGRIAPTAAGGQTCAANIFTGCTHRSLRLPLMPGTASLVHIAMLSPSAASPNLAWLASSSSHAGAAVAMNRRHRNGVRHGENRHEWRRKMHARAPGCTPARVAASNGVYSAFGVVASRTARLARLRCLRYHMTAPRASPALRRMARAGVAARITPARGNMAALATGMAAARIKT